MSFISASECVNAVHTYRGSVYCLCHSVVHACLRQRHIIPGLGLSSIPVQIYIRTRAPVHLYVSLSLSLRKFEPIPRFQFHIHTYLMSILHGLSSEICFLMILKYSLKVCSCLFPLAIQDYPSNFTAQWIDVSNLRPPAARHRPLPPRLDGLNEDGGYPA